MSVHDLAKVDDHRDLADCGHLGQTFGVVERTAEGLAVVLLVGRTDDSPPGPGQDPTEPLRASAGS